METTPQQSAQTQNNAQFSSDSMIKETSQPKSKSSTLLYAGIAVVVVILLAVGGYMLYVRHKTQTNSLTTVPAQQTSQQAQNTVSTSPTPVISPVTTANVDKTLNNTDTTMQQSMNQVNSDLNSINNIDKSQDNTSGL